jgi:hypothetical protein
VTKYTADVRFEVLEFDANSPEEADEMINNLINQLAEVRTDLIWEFVDWDLFELK